MIYRSVSILHHIFSVARMNALWVLHYILEYVLLFPFVLAYKTRHLLVTLGIQLIKHKRTISYIISIEC